MHIIMPYYIKYKHHLSNLREINDAMVNNIITGELYRSKCWSNVMDKHKLSYEIKESNCFGVIKKVKIDFNEQWEWRFKSNKLSLFFNDKLIYTKYYGGF